MSIVLIVEDDSMIADCLEEVLLDAGYEVCGIAATVAEGVRLGESHRPDLAVIDLRLADGEFGTDVAAALCPHGGVGVLYVTGNPDHNRMSQAEGVGCLTKPYSPALLVAALRYVTARMTKIASPPVPVGLTLLGRHSAGIHAAVQAPGV
jgi:two-component system, response regulator PdtaR